MITDELIEALEYELNHIDNKESVYWSSKKDAEGYYEPEAVAARIRKLIEVYYRGNR